MQRQRKKGEEKEEKKIRAREYVLWSYYVWMWLCSRPRQPAARRAESESCKSTRVVRCPGPQWGEV